MATYRDIQEWVRENYGFVPEEPWIEYYQYVFKWPPGRAPDGREPPAGDVLPPERARAIAEALLHFGMAPGLGLDCRYMEDREQLCRYIGLRDLMWWVETKTALLTKVISWDDPYEIPAMLRWTPTERDREIEKLYEGYYAQCWCLSVPDDDEVHASSDCDAMWWKYSSDKQGLMIQTSARRMRQCYAACFLWATLAPVTYSPVKNFLRGEYERRTECMELSPPYYKIDAFAFEHEARLVTLKTYIRKIAREVGDRIAVAVDPRELLTRIIVDPRADPTYVEVVRAYCERAGFDPAIVQHSLLYSRVPVRGKLVYDPATRTVLQEE